MIKIGPIPGGQRLTTAVVAGLAVTSLLAAVTPAAQASSFFKFLESIRFVIAALEKWQFRAATQGGQSAKVEVLLIIPEQSE